MARFAAVVGMVGRRSLGHWRLLSAVVAGVVLSSALMASVFLYSDAIRDLGLKHALAGEPSQSLDLHQFDSYGSSLPSDYTKRQQSIRDLMAAYAGDITSQVWHWGTSATFYPTVPGAAVSPADSKPRAQLQFQDALAAHTTLVAGRMPGVSAPGVPGTDPVVEVAIGKAAADALHVSVGDQFDLHPSWRDDGAVVKATVVGIIQPKDPAEEYWGGEARFVVNSSDYRTYPFFLDEASLVQGIGAAIPEMDISTETLAIVDRGRVTSGNAQAVENRVNALNNALAQNVRSSRLQTTLPGTIEDFRTKLFFTRLPLFTLMIQIVGIVLFYVVMVATMVVERQAGEIALLKSRGASTAQVLAVFAIEAFFICLFAAAAGPFLAIAAIAALGLTPPFHDLSGGHLPHPPLSDGAVGLAALGAFLAFFALLWPAYRACRYSITNYKQEISRPKTQPVFLKYYLDLVVVGVGGLAFYELRQNGSLATTSLFGGKSTDPITLATPSLVILATALVFLRLFPLVLRLVAWAAGRLNGAAVAFALTHMVRSPVQHSRLILLLILTTAVGVFAAGFRATLEQGYRDRAAYQAGAEVRIEDVRKPYAVPTGQFDDAIAAATGTRDFTPVIRLDTSVTLGQYSSTNASIIGVQPDFANFAYWRSDFAGPSLQTIVKRLQQPPADLPPRTAIPAGTRFTGVWMNLSVPSSTVSVALRVRSADGTILDYAMASENVAKAGTWAFYVADMSRPTVNLGNAVDLNAPRTFDSVYLRMQGGPPQVPEEDSASFADLQTTRAASLPAGWGTAGFVNGTVIEPFDDLSRYEVVSGVSAAGSGGTLTRAAAPAGRTGTVARLTFIRGRGGVGLVGFRGATDPRPLPAAVDDGFLAQAQKKVGDEFLAYINGQNVRLKIVASFHLFPGFDPTTGDHLFIASQAGLQDAATRSPGGTGGIFPSEAWLAGAGGTGLTTLTLSAKGVDAEAVLDRQAILASQSADPLIAASWQGILFLSFAAVLLLSALGFVTYSGLSAQARSLEFAILRTMGMSSKQILGIVSFEQCFVVAAGVAAGTLLGFPLNKVMISSMGISEQGSAALPPLLSRIGIDAIVTVYVLLGVVLASTIVALVALYSRLAVSRALRMGEL